MSIVYFQPILHKCKACGEEKLHAYQPRTRHLEHACIDCIKTLPPVPPGMKRCPDCLAIHDRKSNNYCRLCANAYRRASHSPEKGRAWALQYLYDISTEKYDLMFFQQAGVCAICGKPETVIDKRTGKVRALATDHDHENGNVRGLLCAGCNQLLGAIESNPQRYKALKKYMRHHGTQQ